MKSLAGTQDAKLLPYYMEGLICLTLAMQLLLYKMKTVPVPREVSYHIYAHIIKNICNKFCD